MQSSFTFAIAMLVAAALSACGGSSVESSEETVAGSAPEQPDSSPPVASPPASPPLPGSTPASSPPVSSPPVSSPPVSAPPPSPPASPPPTSGGGGGPSNQQRAQAAASTAQSGANACAAIRPFYWEIGDRNAPLATGSIASSSSDVAYTANSRLSIASASKWLYASYVMQKRGGVPTADDIKYLNFRSGYTNFGGCTQGQTVGECQAAGKNDEYSAPNDGKFYYNGGHMEKHATLVGLSNMDNALLASEIKTQLNSQVELGYSQPQLAGGVYMTPTAYAVALRDMLSGRLVIGSMLGSHAVCTNPKTCADAVNAPIPASESWHYSIGHWIEDDPAVGDGAFSSPGAFGFYPWVDAAKKYYGVVARYAPAGAFDSVQCGRLIRKSWLTGTPQ